MSRYDHVGCRTDLFWIEPEKVTRTKSSVHQGPKGHRKVQKDANAAQNRQRGRCYQTKAMSTAPLTSLNQWQRRRQPSKQNKQTKTCNEKQPRPTTGKTQTAAKAKSTNQPATKRKQPPHTRPQRASQGVPRDHTQHPRRGPGRRNNPKIG